VTSERVCVSSEEEKSAPLLDRRPTTTAGGRAEDARFPAAAVRPPEQSKKCSSTSSSPWSCARCARSPRALGTPLGWGLTARSPKEKKEMQGGTTPGNSAGGAADDRRRRVVVVIKSSAPSLMPRTLPNPYPQNPHKVSNHNTRTALNAGPRARAFSLPSLSARRCHSFFFSLLENARRPSHRLAPSWRARPAGHQ
jgi:hypothetical protein